MTKEELEYACSLLPEGACWGDHITAQMALHIAQAARDTVIEECCAAIKSKDDLAADDNYMLDSNDCIKVCRALKSAPGVAKP